MDCSTLLNAALLGDINAITSLIDNQSADELLQLRVTELRNNTILHLASESGSIQVVKAILSKQLLLLPKLNYQGNTALHLAARARHVDIVSALIECAENLDVRREWFQLPESSYYEQIDNIHRMERTLSDNTRVIKDMENGKLEPWRALLQWKNMNSDTALHEATRYNRIQVVTMLLPLDLNFNYEDYPSEALLYMAASRGFDDLVDALTKDSTWSPSYGPDGRTALHGAVICNNKNCTTKLLAWNKSLAAERDAYSQTALHYAAQLGFVDIVRELINVDASLAYITNKKGENVLHVAAKHQQKVVIENLHEEYPLLVNNLVIMKDKEGNTPLHLLAASNCFVPKLIHHPMADKGALNEKKMTPLDLVENDNNSNLCMIATKAESIRFGDGDGEYNKFGPVVKGESVAEIWYCAQNEIADELRRAGAMLFLKDHSFIDIDSDLAEKAKDAEQLNRVKRMLDNHMIVAALIATIAFTAGFAMPGGYIQSGSPNQGLAVLSRNSTAFQAFVISDAMALLFSTSALFLYFSPSLYDILEERRYKIANRVVVGMCLNMVGLGAIIVAFISGTYSVLQYSNTLAIVTSIIGSCIFLIHFIILINIIRAMKKYIDRGGSKIA